jgi:hypothetical protein
MAKLPYVKPDQSNVDCRIKGHQHEMTYLYTIAVGDVDVYQCIESKKHRIRVAQGGGVANKMDRGVFGWHPVKLQDGRVVTDNGRYSKPDGSDQIPDMDPYPQTTDAYKKKTKFTGWSAEDLGF